MKNSPRYLWCLLVLAASGCGGGSSLGSAGGASNGGSQANLSKTLSLVPFNDPWLAARQRWRDIDDQTYSADFRGSFQYGAAQVTLSYDPQPTVPYFVGHIEARGLKPNFSYQLKLAGKPQNGVRGWGERGDDTANSRLGKAARWWNDSWQSNTTDAEFEADMEKPEAERQSIYGYDYMGEFVTDQNGAANLDFNGAFAYHIVWQNKQSGSKDKRFGDFSIGSQNAPFDGYGQVVPTKKVRLWYEWESHRSHNIKLPSGTYNVRFLLTEETFHAYDPENGGLWPTVLASEDFGANGKPDDNAENDVVFTIK